MFGRNSGAVNIKSLRLRFKIISCFMPLLNMLPWKHPQLFYIFKSSTHALDSLRDFIKGHFYFLSEESTKNNYLKPCLKKCYNYILRSQPISVSWEQSRFLYIIKPANNLCQSFQSY